MNSKLMFLLGCIPLRIFFVLLAKYIKRDYLKYLGYIALLPALGFLTIYLFDLRKTGLETGGEKIWWNNLRVIHGLFYLGFALYAIKKNKYAWIFLLLDVILGMTAFLNYRYFSLSNSK